MATRSCSTCGAETPAAAVRFCANCGAQFPDAAATTTAATTTTTTTTADAITTHDAITAQDTAAQDDAVLFPPPPVAYAVPVPATATFATFTTTMGPPLPPVARLVSEEEATKAAIPAHAPSSYAPYQSAAASPATATTAYAQPTYVQPAKSDSFRNTNMSSQQQQQRDQQPALFGEPPLKDYDSKRGFGEPPLKDYDSKRGFGEPPLKDYDSKRGSLSSDEGQSKAGGFLKSRYADHPNCDVCRAGFDIGKRRHQCRKCGRFVCGACSPVRLLIPWGEQIEGARGYDVSVPQRTCLHCAPALHPLQEHLTAMYARANVENSHEAKGRLHLPYTDSLAKECQQAADIIGNFFRNDNAAASDRSIPVAFLERAQGLAVLTVIKAGFMVAGKIGTGLVVARLPDGSWSAPSAIGTAGLSGGFQIGGEIVEVLLILGSRGAVEVFYKPQVNLGAGLDIAVGPYGRAASAAAALSTDTLNANYSYSHSKGLYAGIGLTGSVIVARTDLNRKFYGRDLEPRDLLDGAVAQPVAARPLYDAIDNAMEIAAGHRVVLEVRKTVNTGACRSCNCSKYIAHTHQVWNKKCKRCEHEH